MKMQRIGVNLSYFDDKGRPHDAAPHIGSGFRICTVMIGRKWVRLASHGHRDKILLSEWPKFARHAIEMPERKRKARSKKPLTTKL